MHAAFLVGSAYLTAATGGCAHSQGVRPTTPNAAAHEGRGSLGAVTVTVTAPNDAGSSALVDDGYVRELKMAIEEQWHGRPSQDVRQPVSIQLVLGPDGGVKEIGVSSRSGDSELDYEAMQAVARAHRTTATGELRLYVPDGEQRRRCSTCNARLTITLSAAATE